MDNDNRITGFRAVHPGETLAEELKERGIKQKEPSERTDQGQAQFHYRCCDGVGKGVGHTLRFLDAPTVRLRTRLPCHCPA